MVGLNALVIIDAQTSFDKHLTPAVVGNIGAAVAFARKMHHKVVWVYSHYTDNTKDTERTKAHASEEGAASAAAGDDDAGATPMPTWVPPASDLDAFIRRTHEGKAQYCVPGTPGANFSEKVAHLIAPEDQKVKKAGFSAFRESTLQSFLKRNHVAHMIVAGVTSNVCVLATSYHAHKLGYRVTALSDATNAFNAKKHAHGLETIRGFGGTVCDTRTMMRAEATFGEKAVLRLDAIPADFIDLDFDRIRREVAWCTMISHGNPVPRAVAIQGTVDPAHPSVVPMYRHPVEEQPRPVPWTPTVQRIRDYLSAQLGVDLNHALIQHYRDGSDNIGEHSDKSVDIVPGSLIVNFTVGATRHMLVRKKGESAEHAQRVPLVHNSAFLFDLETNRKWLHEIRPDKRPTATLTPDERRENGARISFTFRTIGTSLDLKSGVLSGQGARNDGQTDVDDSKEMHIAFGAENRQSGEFDWDAQYGCGFNAVYVAAGLSRKFIEPVRADDAEPPVLPQLHFVSGSVPSWRVEVVLRELGIAYTRRREKVMTRLSDKLGALNQRWMTPTFVDVDGTVHRESFALMQYLHATKDAPMRKSHPVLTLPAEEAAVKLPFDLFPSDALQLSRAVELAHAADDWRTKALGPLEHFLLERSGDPKSFDAAGAAELGRLMDAVYEQWDFWERHVVGRAAEGSSPWHCDAPEAPFRPLVGGSLTIADAGFFPVLAYALHRGGFAVAAERFPCTLAYYEALRGRHSFARSAPEYWDLAKVGAPDIFTRAANILLHAAKLRPKV